jgi:hypothetical protein
MAHFQKLLKMQHLIEQIELIKEYIRHHQSEAEMKMRELGESVGFDYSCIKQYIHDENAYISYQERTISNW